MARGHAGGHARLLKPRTATRNNRRPGGRTLRVFFLYTAAIMAEFRFMKEVLAAFGRGSIRLFRCNAGVMWQGLTVEHTQHYLTLKNPRAVHGWPAGSSDLIGWQSVTVTPDMVGTRVAVFVAVETKSLCGRVTPEQQRFLSAVRGAGGRAVAARTLGEVAAVLGPQPEPVASL